MDVAIVDGFFAGSPQIERGFNFADFSRQAKSLAAAIMSRMRINAEDSLVLSYVDIDSMSDLHMEWMGLEGPTDVMSLPMDEIKPGDGRLGILGDIVICPSVAKAQADLQGHSLADELLLLQTHGMLHLLGFDHQRAADKKKMFGAQEKLLENFLGRPAPAATENTNAIDKLMQRKMP